MDGARQGGRVRLRHSRWLLRWQCEFFSWSTDDVKANVLTRPTPSRRDAPLTRLRSRGSRRVALLEELFHHPPYITQCVYSCRHKKREGRKPSLFPNAGSDA